LAYRFYVDEALEHGVMSVSAFYPFDRPLQGPYFFFFGGKGKKKKKKKCFGNQY